MKIRVASRSEIPPGTGREVTVGDRVIAIFNVDGRFFALDGMCPHTGGPLAQGRLDGTIVTCPWHGWQFDVSTGRHCLAPQIRQPCITVETEGDDVYVVLESPEADAPASV